MISILSSIADLLIDISDVLRICCYELGRTYLKLTQALCINIPSVGKWSSLISSMGSNNLHCYRVVVPLLLIASDKYRISLCILSRLRLVQLSTLFSLPIWKCLNSKSVPTSAPQSELLRPVAWSRAAITLRPCPPFHWDWAMGLELDCPWLQRLHCLLH